jgi:hypothetical protein
LRAARGRLLGDTEPSWGNTTTAGRSMLLCFCCDYPDFIRLLLIFPIYFVSSDFPYVLCISFVFFQIQQNETHPPSMAEVTSAF